MAISRKALRIYAALDSLKENPGDDALDALIPVIIPILKVVAGKIFNPRMIVVGVRHLYGWNITEEIGAEFGHRCHERGLIKRITQGDEAVYIVQEIEGDSTGEEKEKLSDVFDKLITEFKDFVNSLSELFSFNKDVNELEELLVEFIVSLGAYSDTDIVERAHFENVRYDPSLEEENDREDLVLTKEDRYLCARFIQHLSEEKSELLKYLSRIAKAGLLRSVVEDFRKPSTLVKESETIIILDAPVAMNYIGVSGNFQKQNARNIFDSLKSVGCKLVLLPVSCDEISGNLSAMFKLERHQRFGHTHKAMIAREVEEPFVRSVMNNPEGAAKSVGIEIRQVKIDDLPSQHQYFSHDQYLDFLSAVTWLRDSPEGREHDAQCMAITTRLSRGERKTDPLECSFLFVTSNPTFARYARRVAVQNGLIDRRHVAPVIHQKELATVAWLRTGFDASHEIPTSQLLSDCEQILTIRKDFIKKTEEVISRVSPENIDQYELLLQDSRAVRRLMDEAHGDEEFVTDENAEKLLAAMWRATAKEIEDEYKERYRKQDERHRDEQERLKKEKDKEIEERDRHIEGSKKKISEYEGHIARQKEERERQNREEVNSLNECIDTANKFSTRLGHVLSLSIIFVAGFLSIDMIFNFFGVSGPNTLPGLALGIVMIYYLSMEITGYKKFGINNICQLIWKWRFSRAVTMKGLARSKYISDVKPISGLAQRIMMKLE